MTYDDNLDRARQALKGAVDELSAELRAYPTPVSGCDAQYNHLVGLRNSAGLALQALEGPAFVATPRMPDPDARVESR